MKRENDSHSLLSLFRRAQNLDKRAAVVGAVLGALTDGLAENEVEVGGEVDRVIEDPGGRVIALGDGRVGLEAALARGAVVGAQRALFLAVGVTERLNQHARRR